MDGVTERADSRSQCYIGAPNDVVLCINGCSNGELKGTLYHSYSTEGFRFENIEQMMFSMEKLYDWLNFPHAGTNGRSFLPAVKPQISHSERKKIMSDESLLSQHGDKSSFIVRVQHRQNSTWQGRITWMEQNQTVYFRSVWEMLKLMESAVDTVSEQEGEESEASWF